MLVPAGSRGDAGAERRSPQPVSRTIRYNTGDVKRPERLDVDGEALLGIPAGSRHNQYSLAQLGAVTQSDGWIVSDFAAGHPPTIQVWRFTGYRHHREQVFVVGPWVDGVTLDAALAEPPSPIRSQRLNWLAMALRALSERVDFHGRLQGDAVVFTEDGRLLFLPPAVMSRLNGVKSPAERLRHVERYQHPHRQGTDQLSFALGVAVYRVLCGRYPFDGNSEEVMHDRVRGFPVVSPITFQPSAPSDLCDVVMASLGQRTETAPTLASWELLLGDDSASDALAELGEPPREALRAAETEAELAERRFARNRFFNRNWRRMVGWGAGAAVALSILVPIIGRALAPPVTRGLEPAEVVELFYESINGMDTEPMEDAAGGDAGRGLINETLHMFLESRMALANRGGSRVVPAPEWDELGRIERPPFRVYGITDLEIRAEQGRPRPIFRAHYHFWTPNLEDIVSVTDPPGVLVTERLWMAWTGKDWVIERLEPIERVPIPASALVTEDAAADSRGGTDN